jgi:transposase
MANRLTMAKVHSILTLHQRGWSNRRIARALGVHRKTVGRYVRLFEREQGRAASNPPPGFPGCGLGEGGSSGAEAASPGSGQVKSLAGSEGADGLAEAPSGPPSACEPFREVILAKLDAGLSGRRIWQDLVAEHGFRGGYDSVKRFVRRLGKATPLPFRRMQCAPGEEAQVDFGRGAPIVPADGRRRGSHVFRVVLGHSRKGYSEAVFRQSTDGFLQALENAFWSFGGVPRTTVIDNLKAAVKKADWFDPELNPKVQAFCEHYGTVILPTKPYTPRHKGKVERGIAYVQSNALKGRTFASLAQENQHLADWEANVADSRIHGTTRKQVGKVFREAEQPALLALPAGRLGFFHEAQRIVHRDGHVEVEKAYYSAPPEHVGHRVWVRWDGRLVRIFTKRMEQIAVHAQHEAGQFSTRSEHIHSRKISSVERGAEWLLGRASLIGANAERWATAMLQARGIEGVRVLLGLVSLGNRYRCEQIDEACAIAVTHEAFRLRTIRELIKRAGAKQEAFEYLAEHEIIRDLAGYDELVAASLRGQPVEAPATKESAS